MPSFKTSLWFVVTVLIVTFSAAYADRALAQENINPSLNADSFTALRMAYSQRPDFDPGWELDEERRERSGIKKAVDQAYLHNDWP